MKRRQCSFAVLAAACAAIGAVSASAQSLPSGVEACLASIQEQRNSATDAATKDVPLLGDVCPDLAEAINDGVWGEALAGVWADQLSTSAFVQLTALVAGYEHPAARESTLRSESLDESLAALKLDKPIAELTIWERIQHWFDEQFGSRGDEARGWLDKWLEHLSPSERVVRYLMIVLGVVLVVATVIVVVNELRVAGVLSGEALRKYSPLAPSTAEPADGGVHDLDDIARAPLARRPALLLALVLDRLRTRRKAPLRDSLTHRELIRAAAGLSAEDGATFAAVVSAAERVTFGDWRPEQRDVDGLLARSQALLASLATGEGAAQ